MLAESGLYAAKGKMTSAHGITTQKTIRRRIAQYLSVALLGFAPHVAVPAAVQAHEESLGLTASEHNYLHRKKVIRACVDPDWMPYEAISEGKHIGISKDYLDLFSQMIRTPIVLVPTTSWSQSLNYLHQGRCDLLPLAAWTPEREKIYDFTQSYLHASMVIATDYSELYVDDIEDAIEHKKIGLVKGYALVEYLRKKFPKNNIVEVANLREGLEKVRRRELYGVIDFLPTLGYLIQRDFIGDLKISAKFMKTLDLRVAVKNNSPELLSILDKCISTVKQRPKNDLLAIERKWTSVVIEKKPEYRLFYLITLAASIVSAFLAIRYYFALKLSKDLHQQSRTDLLTGVMNRRGFYEEANKITTAIRKQGSPIGIAVVDIDHFKQINDCHGHDAGDIVIQFVASQLKEKTRSADVVARMGGEEFAVLLPRADINASFQVAENLLAVIANASIPIDQDKTLNVTVSIGVSEVNSDDGKIDQALKRADDALYQAKNTGRGRVVRYEAS